MYAAYRTTRSLRGEPKSASVVAIEISLQHNHGQSTDEVFEDGRIVLRPDTSAAAIRDRIGAESVTDDEFERAFGHLPSYSEGEACPPRAGIRGGPLSGSTSWRSA